jgi:alkylhydroperoxidase family enzyme
MKHFYDADTVLHLASDRENAGVDEVDVAAMRFAEKVVDDASQITQADVDRLRELGLSDDDVIDVALAAAARCFFSKVLDAVGTQPDSSYLNLDEKLREVLTVGRPISAV